MSSSRFPLSQSIARISWPTKRITTCLCDKCNHSIHFDAYLLDFHDILMKSRSGYYPTATERVAYLGMLEETRNEIERFETELRRLREVSQKLEKQKMLLQGYEAGIRHVISPIQRLPLEILGVIFQFACCGKDATDVPNDYRRYQNNNDRLPTFDINRVCNRWYKLVSSMPILWTSFGNDGCDSRSQSLVRIFLERSRSHLIDFRLSEMVRGEYSPSPLVAHCNRWHHASIAGSVEFVYGAFLKPLIECRKIPFNLISLDLECYLSHSLKMPITFPSLGSLNLRGLVLDFKTPQYTVTTLCLSKVTGGNASKVLLSLTNIKSLELEDIRKYDIEDDSSTSPIVLKKLEALTLMYPIDDDLLTAIEFPPCLAYLCLCNSHSYRFQSMISFLGQTRCALTHLGIKNMSLDREDLLQLFRLVPSLTHLDVEESDALFCFTGTMGSVLELLAGHQHLDSQEAMSEISVDDNVDDGESCDGSAYEVSESEEEDEDIFDVDGTLPGRSEDRSNIQELLLPQLLELDLVVLKPCNKLLLDVVRSRRPILKNSIGFSTERGTCLRTLRVCQPSSSDENPVALSPQIEALCKSLEPFKEGGLTVEIKLPV
ncbi:hypothetical protein F5880DRAFT_1608525 [Lentinula raphanica]|nr:hypothetical protein F5880DRAFT_1608525 [Lentinula raphanica]